MNRTVRVMKKNTKIPKPLCLLLTLLLTLPAGTWGQTTITSLSAMNSDLTADYVIEDDIDATSFASSLGTFTGTLTATAKGDGTYPVISNLSVPIFTTATGATISNIMLKDVEISQAGYVGAICGTADGATRIYNCGILPNDALYTDTSAVGSTDSYCGSLVGFLNGTARVVNCFSFANITSGTVKAGIVGYNNVTSKSGAITTMVMNCMFYGDIAVGGTISPIYGGTQIKNDDSDKLNNYNYFCYENLPSGNITNYNSALAAEERFLVRFEFYRLLLNSTRELAAYYVGATLPDLAGDEKRYDKSEIAKWVLDKSIAPYPILKVQNKYPSIINYNTTGLADYDEAHRNQGRKTGTLAVTILTKSQKTDGGQSWPTAAGSDVQTTSLTLVRTDKDFSNFNFNYDKVQLPYYNDIGTGNYTENRVVTGWKITAMTGGTQGNYYSDSYDVTMSADGNSITKTPYNFADRSTYAKDLYPNQVYSQGAYFNVPDGVTGITIEPYWAACAYVSDPCYDKYGYAKGDVTDFGTRYVNGNNYSINGSSQKVYTSVDNAYNALSNKSSVYDNAIVLVGNYHKDDVNEFKSNNARPYTLMSIDLDMDNEPDYGLIYRSGKQKDLYSIRYDFINMPAMAMAHKTPSNDNMGIPGNSKIRGWFEITNTALIRYNQFEYDNQDKASGFPLILLGGVIEQFVSTNYATDANTNINHTTNIHLGGNVWFKLFSNGVHADKTKHKTARRPISVTGGEYETFYLSGYFQPASPYYANESAECYIDGGVFGEVAGAGQEKIDGNVTWQINHTEIKEFYGGGINPDQPISGNIFVDIKNSTVDIYCGGPKFGNMDDGKTVKTFANQCSFGTYYGAGNGGTALVRQRTFNDWNALNWNWNTDNNKVGTFLSGGANKRGKYSSSNGGISISYEYEHFEGSSNKTVGRFYVNYASLSTAQTNDVFSTLTGCTVLQNFYGGGNLGNVTGDATSMLTDCTVNGNVFGAGFSATAPTADVFPATGFTNHVASPEELNRPRYNSTTGVFEKGEYPTPVKYTWSDIKGANNDANSLVDEIIDEKTYHWIHTEENLNTLGTVGGDAILTLKGTTTVGTLDGGGDLVEGTGSVYGGGEESGVTGNTSVILQQGTHVLGNVYGGGKSGDVGGNSSVTIQDP